jgi:uncharacterized protein (DUF697 family)
MATSAELQKELDAAQAALDSGATSYNYKGAKLSLTGLKNIVNSLTTQVKNAKATESKKAKEESAKARATATTKADQARSTKTALARAESKLKTAEEQQRSALASFRRNEITADEYSAYVTQVEQYQAVITAIEGGAQAIPVGYDDVRILTPAAATPAVAGGRPGVTTTTSTATTGTGTTSPVTPTVTPTTSTTGTTVTTSKGKTAPKPPVATQQNWIDALQKFFPSYSDDWLAANAETYFGKDLLDLMIRVSDPKGVYDLTSSAGLERIQQEIRGTNYWQTTISATKNFDQLIDADKQNLITQTKSRIANTYGDLGLTEDTLNQVATTVARTGLTGLGEKQAVYNATFKATSNQAQTGRALSGVDADRIKQLGKAYNFNVTDSQIQSILTGTPEVSTGQVLTEEGLRQRLQKYVKGAMPQIADQIDAGLTLEDIGGNYRRYAAQLLERSEDEIDMFSGPYLKAFGTKESGQLSLSDWISTVKTDPTFGWQYTKTANQQATDIGLTLARAFGKVG